MFCPTCGRPNPGDATFCSVCGNVFPGKFGRAGATVPPPAAMTIPPRPGVTPRVGEVKVGLFAGRYELQNVLGKGGMGVVYRAKDNELGEEIAVKLLQPQFTKDAHEVDRFKREILTARRITHPNVIRIHDYGTSGDEFFISMELLPGGTLADRIAAGVTLTEAVEIAAGVAEGLGAAHAKRVVHRDIKPHNVLFDADGIPKLVDFGIARFATATRATRGFAGTPHYISPEQAKGEDATERSDIYSLGVLLFELFTGKLPFDADSLVALAVKHAQEPPPPPRSIRPDLPVAIEAIVLKCLEKNPANRYSTPSGITADLRALAIGHIPEAPRSTGQPASLRPTPPPVSRPTPAPTAAPIPISALASAPPPNPAVTPYPPTIPTTRRGPRRSGCLIASVLVGTIVASCAGLLILPPIVEEQNKRTKALEDAKSGFDIDVGADDDDHAIFDSPVPTKTLLAFRTPIVAPPTPPPRPDLNVAIRRATPWGWSFTPPAGWTAFESGDGTIRLGNAHVYGKIVVSSGPGMALDHVRLQSDQPLPFEGALFLPTSATRTIAGGRGFALDYASNDGLQSAHGAAVTVPNGLAFVFGLTSPNDVDANRARVEAVAASIQASGGY